VRAERVSERGSPGFHREPAPRPNPRGSLATRPRLDSGARREFARPSTRSRASQSLGRSTVASRPARFRVSRDQDCDTLTGRDSAGFGCPASARGAERGARTSLDQRADAARRDAAIRHVGRSKRRELHASRQLRGRASRAVTSRRASPATSTPARCRRAARSRGSPSSPPQTEHQRAQLPWYLEPRGRRAQRPSEDERRDSGAADRRAFAPSHGAAGPGRGHPRDSRVR